MIRGVLGRSIKAFQTSENNREATSGMGLCCRICLSKLLTIVYRGIEVVT